MRIAVIGGGAAGFFAAIAAASRQPEWHVEIVEAARSPLQKVRISGGGRCNVTHHCFDPRQLVTAYPRGSRELFGPFTRFGPRETVEWFESRGVRLKTEADGRIFPETDRSSTVIDCLERAARDGGVRLRTGVSVRSVARSDRGGAFDVITAPDRRESYDRVLLATGGNPAGYRLAAAVGHRVSPPVPSLFTFEVADPRLRGLAGLRFDRVEVSLAGRAGPVPSQSGALLITHWGLSGPAILKLSAWGARALADRGYHADIRINFVPGRSREHVVDRLRGYKATGARLVRSERPFGLPARYWSAVVRLVGVSDVARWAEVSRKTLDVLADELTAARFEVSGRGIFKEEFVTCGGVDLSEVDFKTMESRVVPGLYLAGEVLDIDGITGGFNFQSAWTTGWIAGTHVR